MSCKLGCNWDINGGHGDGRGHEQARLQRIFCVAITEGATSYWVGLKWDTFSALVRPLYRGTLIALNCLILLACILCNWNSEVQCVNNISEQKDHILFII